MLPYSAILASTLSNSKSVPSLIPRGLCPSWESCLSEYPARLIKPYGKFRGWNPVSCLHSTNSSGRLRCTPPYYKYCIVSPRSGSTCNSLPYTPALQMNEITRPCSFSYFWSSRRIFATILLLTVRDYVGILVLQEGTIVTALPRTYIFWGFRFLAEPCLGLVSSPIFTRYQHAVR